MFFWKRGLPWYPLFAHALLLSWVWGLNHAPGRLPPMRGRCFHNRVIVSAEALFVLAEQNSSFVSP